MSLKLTRRELYDLVWTKPRRQIAKEFEISDVYLGKLCREMNVPAPPRGYWANLAGRRRRRKFERPPLTFSFAERIEEDHATIWASFPDFDPKDLDQRVPPPPALPVSLEEAVGRYKLLVERTPIPKSTRGLHPITQKLVAEDERVAKLAGQYSWEKPRFQSPEGKELLVGLNRVFWMWTDLGFKSSGRGHRDTRLWVSRGGYGRSFEITNAEATRNEAGRVMKTRRPRFELRFDTQAWERRSKKPDLAFSAFTRSVLRSIALSLIEHWESGFRESVKRSYEWRVAERKEALEEAEQAREHERRRKVAELKALLDSRQKLLQDGVSGLNRSSEIRSLVQALDERVGSRTEEVPRFERWREWALMQAEAVDPRARSVEQLNAWLAEFRLDNATA